MEAISLLTATLLLTYIYTFCFNEKFVKNSALVMYVKLYTGNVWITHQQDGDKIVSKLYQLLSNWFYIKNTITCNVY